MANKYTFERDDDCHWYLIPLKMSSVFHFMLEQEDDCNFNNTFYKYRCNSPCEYTFENPE